jgi:hypothetical protein
MRLLPLRLWQKQQVTARTPRRGLQDSARYTFARKVLVWQFPS